MSSTSVARLRAFLKHRARPAGTLTYHELRGFLFAVVSAPELIQPSEWLPMIFNEHEAGYTTLDEANAILGQFMALYNEINAAVLEQRVALPDDCRARPRALDNLEDSAPLARWSRGFVLGHQWLEELWDADLPEDWDEEFGAALMTLSFFSSRDLAEAFHRESALGTESLEGLAESMLRVLPDAVAEYAYLGRSILGGGCAEAGRARHFPEKSRVLPARKVVGEHKSEKVISLAGTQFTFSTGQG